MKEICQVVLQSVRLRGILHFNPIECSPKLRMFDFDMGQDYPFE